MPAAHNRRLDQMSPLAPWEQARKAHRWSVCRLACHTCQPRPSGGSCASAQVASCMFGWRQRNSRPQ
eukprot:11091967-Alexandrium_andersonii.AAC.1